MTQMHETVVSPSVRHITDVIEARIRSGKYPHGRWLPSEREIADEFGVSRIVIKSVVNELDNRALVIRSARCRPVVRNAADVDVPTEFILPETRRSSIGLWIWPNPRQPGIATIVQGITRTLDPDAFRMIIASPHVTDWVSAARSESQFLLRMAQDRDIVGIILWYLGGETNLPALVTLREAHIPLVFIDRRPPAGFSADYVGVDNIHSAEEVVKHLVAQGHRSIAHISNFDTASTVYERLTGYRRALKASGLPYRPELVQHAPDPTDGDPSEGCAALLDILLGLPDPPTALFAVNDYIALRLKAAIQVRGLTVPGDIALAGFDGIERWLPGRSFLTTANQPFERIGARAVDALLKHLTLGSEALAEHILLEAPLSISSSTVP